MSKLLHITDNGSTHNISKQHWKHDDSDKRGRLGTGTYYTKPVVSNAAVTAAGTVPVSLLVLPSKPLRPVILVRSAGMGPPILLSLSHSPLNDEASR
jgi:hypothetical protein